MLSQAAACDWTIITTSTSGQETAPGTLPIYKTEPFVLTILFSLLLCHEMLYLIILDLDLLLVC